MLRFFGFGLLFGFFLTRAGATDGDAIVRMFLLEDLHLAGVIGVAVVVAGSGLRLLRRAGAVEGIAPKPMKPGLVAGGLLFGVGWALTGTCPGTGLAQIGEGRLMALFTIGGLFLGTALHGSLGVRLEGWLAARRTKATLARDA
jgi:uncharacterized membrane protein YedE/YeeE